MSQFLFEKIDAIKEASYVRKDIPDYIINNFSSKIKLREYQTEALENFLIYNETKLSKDKQIWNLFHMATGSGKTIIMASLILYLYKTGYRNFVFFVKNINIIDKTVENFTNPKSSKYLFSEKIIIDNSEVRIVKVDNFQATNPDNINICFTSNSSLLNSFSLLPKENSLSRSDFIENKIVLIADEAHHLNAQTKNGKPEYIDDSDKTWEETATTALISNKENILIEFTATCDLKNLFVQKKYSDKIVYDYPLSKFRENKYSKDIISLPSTSDLIKRAIVAIIMSEYRHMLFLDINNSIKPIVMFKSKNVNDSIEFYNRFFEFVEKELDSNYLLSIKTQNSNELIIKAFDYFSKNKKSLENIVIGIKMSFSKEHSLIIDSTKNKIKKEDALLLNSLENESNPYRLIFVVDMLNEGWDVLNLFDIVRLYDERQGPHGKTEKISKYTISEAQLIGRGARYYPFKTFDYQIDHKRKFDDDLNNDYRICELLIYHCTADSKYINEIKLALKEIGLLSSYDVIKLDLKIKDSFKKSNLFKFGSIYINEKFEESRENIKELPNKLRLSPVEYNINYEIKESQQMFNSEKVNFKNKKVKSIIVKEIPSNLKNKGIRKFSELKLTKLKEKFPNLNSTFEFINENNYLGSMKINISYDENYILTNIDIYNSYLFLLKIVVSEINKIKVNYIGTKHFKEVPVKFLLRDLVISRTVLNNSSGGEGYSQNDHLVPETIRLDLNKEDWYVYNDNYGTSEEKKLVKFIYANLDKIKVKYEEIYLIRNEGLFGIYSFDTGDRFEPDFLMFLTEKGEIFTYLQIFIEPKGSHLLIQDSWKEKFLKEITEQKIEYTTIVDNAEYRIIGLPFFNEERKMEEFITSFNGLL